jgi:hypothetical protein
MNDETNESADVKAIAALTEIENAIGELGRLALDIEHKAAVAQYQLGRITARLKAQLEGEE